MRTSKLLATVCSAVVVSIATISPPSEARNSEKPANCETSEEQIGTNKFQVAKMLINATPIQVQSVLTDYEHTAAIFTGVKSCRVIEDNGADKKINFVATVPGNLWTFDYTLAIHESPGYIEWRRQCGAFKRNEGFWRLEPVDNGRSTRVTYAKFVDAGFIPQSMVVHELRASMPTVLANLKTNAEASNMAEIELKTNTN